MNVQKLVRMANQIAANFDYGENSDEAVAGVVDHLTRFWTPEMKDAIVDHARSGETGLSELAARAVGVLAERRNAAA